MTRLVRVAPPELPAIGDDGWEGFAPAPPRRSLPPGLLAALTVLLLGFGLSLMVPPAGDLPWRLHVGGVLLDGGRLYVDAVETNPPLWFWAAMVPEWLARLTPIPAYVWLTGLAAAGAGLTLWLWDRCTASLLNPAQRQAGWIAIAAVLAILPLAETGQREMAALSAALLWLGLAAARMDGLGVGLLVTVPVALLASYGFALKHYFVLVPMACELALLLGMRRQWRPIRPETLILAGAAFAYGLAVVLLTPTFFSRALPLVALSYDGFGPVAALGVWPVLQRCLEQSAMVLVPLVVAVLVRERRALVWGLIGAALLFALVAVLQLKGWRYHFFAAHGAAIVALVLVLADSPKAIVRRAASALGLALVAMFAAGPVLGSLSHRGQAVDPAIDRLINEASRQDRVMVLSVGPEVAVARPMAQGLPVLSRHYGLWMLPGLLRPSDNADVNQRRAAALAVVLDEFREDLRCAPPDLIVSQAMESRLTGQTISPIELVLSDPSFQRWFDTHYRRTPDPGVAAFTPRSTRPPDAACQRFGARRLISAN